MKLLGISKRLIMYNKHDKKKKSSEREMNLFLLLAYGITTDRVMLGHQVPVYGEYMTSALSGELWNSSIGVFNRSLVVACQPGYI